MNRRSNAMIIMGLATLIAVTAVLYLLGTPFWAALAIGVVLAPALSAIGIGVMALSDYTFYIDKEDGSSINVNEWIMGSNKADDRTSNDPDQGTDA